MSMLLSEFVPPSPSLLGPQVHSLRLHLYSCPANSFFFFFLKRSCFVGEIVILFIYLLILAVL